MAWLSLPPLVLMTTRALARIIARHLGGTRCLGKAQFVNRMRHLVTAAARQARSLAPGARPTRWNQLR